MSPSSSARSRRSPSRCACCGVILPTRSAMAFRAADISPTSSRVVRIAPSSRTSSAAPVIRLIAGVAVEALRSPWMGRPRVSTRAAFRSSATSAVARSMVAGLIADVSRGGLPWRKASMSRVAPMPHLAAGMIVAPRT